MKMEVLNGLMDLLWIILRGVMVNQTMGVIIKF